MTFRFTFFLCLLFISFQGIAQTYKVSGSVKDAGDSSNLIGVNVILTKSDDSTQKTGTATDSFGNFKFENVSSGSYKLQFNYVGYKKRFKRVMVSGADVSLGVISMQNEATNLKGVTVEGKQIRAEQMGDTTQFRADAYKTHPDATAEDLVSKMPGVTSDNNGVKVNGETVQQVYVDGKPFFGNDPTLALRNLPSEVIDKIQVFDKLSDQATFTGFDDGNAQKTMNIMTKRNKSEGVFGKVYAGYGTDDRFLAGGNLNIFDGDRRFSILALSNNINQQNFSTQDILGVIGNSSGQNRGGGGGMGGMGRGNFGGGGGGGSSANNFMVGQQGGVTTTNSVGLNYSDNWGKKIKVMGSYFYNSTDNVNNSNLTRNYFTSNDTSNIYHERDSTEAKNFNHRINFRLEYTIDSFNSIIFTPSINFQKNNSISSTLATDSLGEFLSGRTANRTTSNNSGYNTNSNLLLQHKFSKPRRTISININPSINEKSGTGTYYALNNYYSTKDSTLLNQNNTQYNHGYTLATSLIYTEPIGKKGQLLVSYNPSISKNYADKETYNDTPAHRNNFDTFLSNKYASNYAVQKGGVGYRLADKKYNLMFGVNYQYAELSGDQTFPYNLTLPTKYFNSVLPNAMFNFRFADGRNLRIMYFTNTVAPSVTQLQDVVDISNPLLLKTGNPNLKQDYEHTLNVRYGLTKSKTAHNFFVYLFGKYVNDYIANATYQPLRDSLFKGTFMTQPLFINKGSQLTLPVNLSGYWTEKAYVTYSVPAEFIKSNLNFNGGVNFTRTPGLVNNATNYANNTVPTLGVVLSSNISEKIDFTLSYTGNYNIVKNSIQTSANNNYFNYVAGFKINLILIKNLVLNTNITNNYYTAFSSTGTQNYFLWNTYIGYKFMKKQAMEARLTFYDMLNQNKSISRTVTETYVENSVTQVLQQYLMFQLTYTIRNFKGAPPQQDTKNEHEHDNPMFRQWRDGGRNQ